MRILFHDKELPIVSKVKSRKTVHKSRKTVHNKSMLERLIEFQMYNSELIFVIGVLLLLCGCISLVITILHPSILKWMFTVTIIVLGTIPMFAFDE